MKEIEEFRRLFLDIIIKELEENKKNTNKCHKFNIKNMGIATTMIINTVGPMEKKNRIRILNELIDSVNATVFEIENGGLQND
jgi:hypothetical protein